MKVLMIISHFWPQMAGAEVFAKNISEYLVKKGHRVDILTGRWKKEWKMQEKIKGVRIIRVKPWLNFRPFKTIGIFFPLFSKALHLTKVRNYDLVHVHIFPASIVGALVKRETPLIVTVQGGDIGDYSENFGMFSPFLRLIISQALKKAEVVHAVSYDLEKSLKKMGVKRIKVIPNGVNTKIFKKRNKKKTKTKLQIPSSKFVIVSHSRLTFKNGLDLLIKAVAKIKEKSNILVFLIGEGYLRNRLEKLMHRTDLCNQIKFLGYKRQEEIAEYLAASDVFVRPSRQEGFGIAFLESMAVGLSVIGTRVGGIPDFVIHKKNGLLIAPENIKELTKAIKLLKKNKNLRKKLGKNARKMVLKKYAWPKICQQIENLYKGLGQF